MSDLKSYVAAADPIPGRMLKWHLYGEGLDNLRVEEVDVPAIGPDELLVRQDACGICFSDLKVIALGSNHPRMAGRDLRTDPVTLGHEVSCTVVRVGANLEGRFHVGQRFIVQADVFHGGVSMAYGYAISGGFAQYSRIPVSMIEGDEGCYLLPVRPVDGYAEAALVEPWACVVSAYNQGHRAGIRPGGALVVIAGADAGPIDWTGAVAGGEPPAQATLIGASDDVVRACVAGLGGIASVRLMDAPPTWSTLKAQTPEGAGFDDVVVLGAVAPEIVEGAATALANHAALSLVGGTPLPRKLSIDIGRVHYNWHHYLGTTGSRVADAYSERRGADLVRGGLAWFIGAGGPMGQMHVQRAVFHPEPPRRIVGTDIDVERLQSLADRFGSAAAARDIDLVLLNPREMGKDAFDAEIRRLSDGRGYDDIVSLVPVPALIEHASGHLADGAWFNVFAGVARGTMASIDVEAVRSRGVRYVGSSGSSIADMRETLEKVEGGELSTNASLAAIGGMRAVREGIAAVRDGRFPGKTLIFPLIEDLPLLSLADLRQAYPSVYERLRDGRFWTREAEQELLRLAIEGR